MRLLTLAAVFAAVAAVPALAEDLEFTLINASSHVITEIYLSPHEQDTWGENILTVAAVDPGAEGLVSVADGETVCDYDIKVVTATGTSAEVTQDLCELSTFTVND